MVRAAAKRKLSIDARPRGPEGPLASHALQGRPILGHLLELADELGEFHGPIAVHARADEHPQLRSVLEELNGPPVELRTGPPPEASLILRADRLYDPRRLRRAFRRGNDLETAVIWRLDAQHGLEGAEAELIRRRTYQPIGKYWALLPARVLARLLAPTRVRPNALTLLAASLMLVAAGLVAAGLVGGWARYAAAACLAVALVLDTADGHLARLQGTSTAFGRWLDSTLDEVADLALHSAIAWAAFQRTGMPAWLLVGLAYVCGKHLFLQSSAEWDQISAAGAEAGSRAVAVRRKVPLSTRLVRGLGHADLRWHLWIVLAAVGRLEVALVAYSAYYPLRMLAGVPGKRRS